MSAAAPLLHVVPGADTHGVVRHGLLVHDHLGGAELLRCGRLDELADGALAGRAVVLQATDQVLAADPESALNTWRRLLPGVVRATVVLHDLPQASDGRWRPARTRLYSALAADADEVVVASTHELLLLTAVVRWARPTAAEAILARTHVIPLPVARTSIAWTAPQAPPTTVVTLGHIYPGKGLEEVIDAAALAARDPRLAARTVQVQNLGGAASGHEDMLDALAARARTAGVSWTATGWVEEDDLPALLATAGVPVAAHQHLSASGSIASWLSAGRRPVVLRSRYADELASRTPGALTVVTPDRLGDALADALADPASTWLSQDVRLGPSVSAAGALLGEVAHGPAVSVVVPYYRDQEMLDLILRRLQEQVGVIGGLEVVVADDGSPEPPRVPDGPMPVRVVRQVDLGFRAAAARNLGARAGRGRVLLFLDGDTAPEDGYSAALQSVCLNAPTLAVGLRRHAPLRPAASTSPDPRWPPSEPLEGPRWLADAYAASDDLRAADDSSFRFVLSAVMGVSRSVWEAVSGFDESFVGYGGEDWDLAWRAWLAGADLRHVPGAVAWHDGPDLAGRAEGLDDQSMARVKNTETQRLATILPHPLTRGRGWWHPQPDVVVLLRAQTWTSAQVQVVLESVLRLGDVGVWGSPLTGTDPRVRSGSPAVTVLERARVVVEVLRPVAILRLPWERSPHDLTGTVEGPGSPLLTDSASGVRVRATRHTRRAVLAGAAEPPAWLPAGWVEDVESHVVVERWRQGHP